MNQTLLQTELPRRRIPVPPGLILPIFTVVASVVIQCCPAAQTVLQYDRGAISAGQQWRLMTGHMVHWGWRHLAGDISALILLCWAINPRGGWKVTLAALGGAVVISLAIMIFDPGTVIYRGMSGVNYGLLAWAVLARLAASSGRTAACYAATLAALAAKVLVDAFAPDLLPSVGLPEGITLTGIAHAAGFYAVMLIWIGKNGNWLRSRAGGGACPHSCS
ncbi:MAG: rhombosortase [bacterium]|nr:rhombosortase [bacterium]